MAGLFQMLSIGTQGLLTSQLAQATVGNNAANSATPGYSRRRTSLAELPPVLVGTQLLGSGVQAVGIQRLRDSLLDSQFRLDTQDQTFAKTRAGLLGQIGALLSPADSSALGTALDGLWAAFGDLATRPEDGATRRALLAQGQQLVDAAHQTREKLESLSRDVTSQIADRVADVNATAQKLAALNGEIKTLPNDPSIADARDQLIDHLSELIGVRATTRDDGTVQVVIDGTGIQIVDGVRAATVDASGNPISGLVTLSADGSALTAAGGELGGLLRVRNSSSDGLPYAFAQLDALVSGVIGAVNRAHASGAGLTLAASVTGSVTVSNTAAPLASTGLAFTPVTGNLSVGVFDSTGAMVSMSTLAVDPSTMSLTDLATALSALPNVSASVWSGRLIVSATGGNRLAFGADTSDTLLALGVNGFFTGSDASSIAVDPALVTNPSLIAAARADLATGRVSPGDGSNASALAALGRARLFNGGTDTAAGALGAFGATIGAATRAAQSRADTLAQIVQSVDAQRQSVSGVNIDEELADMVRYQHAYQASSKFVQTVSEMIDTLLNMV